MINTIPQAGTKPVGPRLAGLSASFDVIRRLAFGFSWISNKNLCTIWMSLIVQGHAPWTAPQPSQPYPYLLCPWVALFHIFLYIYLDNLAPSLRPQSVARAQSLVFQGPPSRVVAFPSRDSQGQATRTTSYLGEPQTNAGRLYTVFPIVQISASFIAIHITTLFTFSIFFAGPEQTRRVVDVFSKSVSSSVSYNPYQPRDPQYQQKQPRMCIVCAFSEEVGGDWKEWSGVTYVRQPPLQQSQQPLPQLSRKGKSTTHGLTFSPPQVTTSSSNG